MNSAFTGLFLFCFLGLACTAKQTMLRADETGKTPASTEANNLTHDEDEDKAAEPIPISGAYLACSYAPKQEQGGASYNITCEVEKRADIEANIIRAEVHKLDSLGRAIPLDIQKQDLTRLAFTIIEPARTVFYPQLRLTLIADTGASAQLETSLSSLSVTINSRFWLAGEPNNSIEAGVTENCAEYQNAIAQQAHTVTSGLSQGPLGRLNDNQCSMTLRFVCRSMDSLAPQPWTLSSYMGPFADFAKACPEGYRFALPMTDDEVISLNTVVDAVNVFDRFWVPLSDQDLEGAFVIPLQ